MSKAFKNKFRFNGFLSRASYGKVTGAILTGGAEIEIRVEVHSLWDKKFLGAVDLPINATNYTVNNLPFPALVRIIGTDKTSNVESAIADKRQTIQQ